MQLIYRNKVRAKKQEKIKEGRIIKFKDLNKNHRFLKNLPVDVGSVNLQPDTYSRIANNINNRTKIILNIIYVVEILNREIYMKEQDTLWFAG